MVESVIISDSESDDNLGILDQLKAEKLDSPARKPVQNGTDVISVPIEQIPAEDFPILAIEPIQPVESTKKMDAVVIPSCPPVLTEQIPSCPPLELINSDNDDDDEPLEDLVQRKVSTETNNERNQFAENSEQNQFAGIDDCAIVDPPIRPNSPDSEEMSENVDEDISVRVDQLAESFTLTHPRHSCPKFTKFQFTEIKNHIILENEQFCPKCFCYLCEVEASKCEYWTNRDCRHCNAFHPGNAASKSFETGMWSKYSNCWKNLRSKIHQAKNPCPDPQPVEPLPREEIHLNHFQREATEAVRRREEMDRREQENRPCGWGRDVERNSDDDDVWNQATTSGWGSSKSPKKLSIRELCIGQDWDGKDDKKYYFDGTDNPTGESDNQNQEGTLTKQNSRKFRGRPNWGSNQNPNPENRNSFYNNGNQQSDLIQNETESNIERSVIEIPDSSDEAREEFETQANTEFNRNLFHGDPAGGSNPLANRPTMPSRGRLGRPRRKIGDQSRNHSRGSEQRNKDDDGNWFGGNTNWRNEMAYRWGNNSPPKPNTHIRFDEDSEESPKRPGPSNQRDEPRRRRRSAGSDGPLIKLVSSYGPRSSAEDGSQDDGDAYQTGDEFARTRDDRRPRLQRSQPRSQSRSEPHWNNRSFNTQQFDRNNRKRNWGQIGAREYQYDPEESNNRDHSLNRTRNDHNDDYDESYHSRREPTRDHNDQQLKRCHQSKHCCCNASLNAPRSRNRYYDREYDDSTDDDNNDYYDPKSRYHNHGDKNLPPRRKRFNQNHEDYNDQNSDYNNSRVDSRPADFQRRNHRQYANSSNSILKEARGTRDGACRRFDNRSGRNIHVTRSKNDNFDQSSEWQSKGESHREMDNSFGKSQLTQVGGQTYYNQGQSRNRRHIDLNRDLDDQNRVRENQIDIKTDPTDDYQQGGRNQTQFNHGRTREKWSDEAHQGNQGPNHARSDHNRGRGRARRRGYYRGGHGHYHYGNRRGNNGYRDEQNHGCNNSSEQDFH